MSQRFCQAIVLAVLLEVFVPPAACRADSSIVAWGPGSPLLTNIPPDITNAVALSAGGDHVLALNADGTLVAWGTNTYGQTNIPRGLTNAIAIAAGSSHNLAL